MSNELERMLSDFESLRKQCSTFSFLPRDENLQEEAVEDAENFISEIEEFLNDSSKSEEKLNKALSLKYAAKAMKSELAMWIDLKSENWGNAWENLIDAQEHLQNSWTAHEIMRSEPVMNLSTKYNLVEKFVFPPQNFTSPGFVVDKFKCSICGEDYNGDQCDHIESRAYSGELCRKVVDGLNLREVSLVDEPEDKRHRITRFTTEDGMVRDKMTWEKFDPSEVPDFSEFEEGERIFEGIVMTADDIE